MDLAVGLYAALGNDEPSFAHCEFKLALAIGNAERYFLQRYLHERKKLAALCAMKKNAPPGSSRGGAF